MNAKLLTCGISLFLIAGLLGGAVLPWLTPTLVAAGSIVPGTGYSGGPTIRPTPVPITSLTEAEIAGLRYMREEEKLAHDVYLALYQTWNLPTFQNIAASEQTHTDTLKALLLRYKISDPTAELAPGVFSNPTLQKLYNQLVAQGRTSLAEALKVGALIEETDIRDLDLHIAETTHNDLKTAYQNLRQGSANHLRAFVSAWERQTGQTYQPQVLSAAAYQAIMAGTSGGGRGGPGQGGGGNRP